MNWNVKKPGRNLEATSRSAQPGHQVVAEGEPGAPELTIKEIIGQNLKAAREAADISQEQFAEMLGVSRATLSGFENGHVAIDSVRLLKAAELLGKPVGEFFKQDEEALALLYRSAEDVVPSSSVRAQFQRLCDAYRELEEIVGVADTILPPPEYRYSAAFHSKPYQFAAQVAQSERERLGLGQNDPIENIFKMLDENGVRIFALNIDQDRVFGVSGFSERYGPCVLVNTKNTRERNIFTLAHEYGHLLMHRDFYVNPRPTEQKDREMEMVADTFAAHFLVPDVGLRDLFTKNVGQKSIGVEDIIFLKRYFRVSAQVILRRIRDGDLIPSQEHDEQLDRLRKAEPDKTKEFAPISMDLVGSWKETCRFQHLARKAALAEMVSIGKLAELLGKNLVQIRAQVQDWRKEIALVSA